MAELAVGVVVVLFAIGLIQHHRETYRAKSAVGSSRDEKNASTEASQSEEDFLARQHRRRMIASGLMALIGILLIVDFTFRLSIDVEGTKEQLWPSVILISIVLLLLPVLFTLAAVDFFRTQSHLREGLNQAVDAKAALIQEAERLAIIKQQNANSENQSPENREAMDGSDTNDS